MQPIEVFSNIAIIGECNSCKHSIFLTYKFLKRRKKVRPPASTNFSKV